MYQTMKHPSLVNQTKAQSIPMPVYAREGYKVLPLCSGFVVVGRDGKEIDRYKVGEVGEAVELVDELVLRVA